MEYREKAHWKIGDDIITVVGGEEKKPIAFIKLEKYDENKKPVLSCRDLDGNPLFASTANLYDLKRDLKNKEVELTQAMQAKEQPQQTTDRPDVPAEQIEVPAPQQESVTKTPNQEKGNELKKVRRSKSDKSQKTEQTIPH